jgi:O-antigen chain-terminating methyltransferase
MEKESTPMMSVQDIMQKIREEIQEKIRQGEIPPGEREHIAKKKLEVPPPVYKSVREEIQKRLSMINYTYDTRVPAEITSHRKTIGPLLIKGKNFLRKLTQSYINLILGRQVEFNAAMVKIQNNLVPAFFNLEKELDLLGNEVQEGLKKEIEELKGRLSVIQQTLLTLKKDLETSSIHTSIPAATSAPAPTPASMDADLYYLFEDLHRGLRAEVKEKQRPYLKFFTDGGEVLDIGCGRGEFLELLKETGVPAYGIDINPHMIKSCLDLGLKALEAEALAHLRTLPDERLGGIFMAQLVEHLSPWELITLLKECFLKLAPGGVLIAETINPTCLATFSGAFYLDLTHKNPIHPESLRELLKNLGFGETQVIFTSPFPKDMQLEEAERLGDGSFPDEVADTLNRNMQKLNPLLFGYQDYAVVARKIQG